MTEKEMIFFKLMGEFCALIQKYKFDFEICSELSGNARIYYINIYIQGKEKFSPVFLKGSSNHPTLEGAVTEIMPFLQEFKNDN